MTEDTSLEYLPEWARDLFASWSKSDINAYRTPSHSYGLRYGAREKRTRRGRLLVVEPSLKDTILFRTMDSHDNRLRAFAQATSVEEAETVVKRFSSKPFRAPRRWTIERALDARADRAAARKRNFFTKRGAVWRLLEKRGVATASFRWSGSGDSGGLDEAAYLDKEGKPVEVPQSVTDEIDEAAVSALELGFDNEGSEGDLTLDVKARTANGNVGYPSVEWYTRSLHERAKSAKS
jgi:hypothetical protein